jgi:hypothetical protein
MGETEFHEDVLGRGGNRNEDVRLGTRQLHDWGFRESWRVHRFVVPGRHVVAAAVPNFFDHTQKLRSDER